MWKRFLVRTVVASLLVPVGMTLGCQGQSPSAPLPFPTGPAAPRPAVSVTSIFPRSGSTLGTAVSILGFGFQPGATVTVDGIAASGTVLSGTAIAATTPAHAVGTVDVVVTNPGGESARLAEAFTYIVVLPYSVTADPSTVAPGGQLSVTWTAPPGGEAEWIGLFRVGDPDTAELWHGSTVGGTSGTFTLNAPAQPGQYEFRYLVYEGYVVKARSTPVTVG